MIAYIFYVHNTITQYQINMAINSIIDATQGVNGDLWIHNSSTQHSSSDILKSVDCLRSFFDSINVLNRKGSSVAEDVTNQLSEISGYDYYVCHKADFYVGANSFKNTILKLKTLYPTFINYSKFDLRENVDTTTIWSLSTLNFNEILQAEWACDMTLETPQDFSKKYTAMGYRGIDGVMHGYNELARDKLVVSTYWEQSTVDYNRSIGIDMQHGHNDILALHMYHEIPGGRNSIKDEEMGFRF